MATPNFAHVPKSLVLVQMVLIALPMHGMDGKGRAHTRNGSEVALGLHRGYFAQMLLIAAVHGRPGELGAAASMLTELGCSCVCRNNIPCKSCQCLLFPSVFLKPLYSFLLFHLTTGWARAKTFCVWLETLPNSQTGQRKKAWFETFTLVKIWISSLSRCWFSCNS